MAENNIFDQMKSGIQKGAGKGWSAVQKGAAAGLDVMQKGAATGFDAVQKGAAASLDVVQKGAVASLDTVQKGAVVGLDAVQKGMAAGWDAVQKGAAAGFDAVQSGAGVVQQGVGVLANSAVGAIDLNGDGQFDQEDILILLDEIYGKSCNGVPNVSKTVEDFSEEYLNRYHEPRKAANKMVDNAVAKCTTSGFLTGLGGLITLPVTLPANVTSVLYVQMRMIASIAYMSGLDVHTDAVQTLVYACLAGVSVAEIVKKTGIQFGNKLAISMVKKIPGEVLVKINQKVGFRFLTKFGEKGIINLGKAVPVVGGVIGGGFDMVETKVIANRAIHEFMDGDFGES